MIPQLSQINHDISVLYLFARQVMPREVLGLLLYELPEEPSEQELSDGQQLVLANRKDRGEEQDGSD